MAGQTKDAAVPTYDFGPLPNCASTLQWLGDWLEKRSLARIVAIKSLPRSRPSNLSKLVGKYVQASPSGVVHDRYPSNEIAGQKVLRTERTSTFGFQRVQSIADVAALFAPQLFSILA